jgi:hypothetical protein
VWLCEAEELQPPTPPSFSVLLLHNVEYRIVQLDMDPASAVGIASGTVGLVAILGQGVLKIKEMLDGVRDIERDISAFGGELDAFQFGLKLLEKEIQQNQPPPQRPRWQSQDHLNTILNNATRTFAQIQEIFHDIGKRRKKIGNIRAYYRKSRYDRQIGILRGRIATYTSTLSIFVMLQAA